MKPVVFCSLTGIAILLASTVDAQGQMLVPSYRPITSNAARPTSLPPQPSTSNGFRGLVYESENNVTEIEAAKEFDVEYYIQAPHPGYMMLNIVKPSTDSDGKITYNRDTEIEYVSDFANSAVLLALGYRQPDVPTCADITIPGSGAGSSSSTSTTTSTTTVSSTSSSASQASTTKTTTTAPTVTTATPAATATTTDDSEAAGDASYTTDSTDTSADDASMTGASTDTTHTSSDDTTTSSTTDVPTTTTATTTDAPEATSSQRHRAPIRTSALCVAAAACVSRWMNSAKSLTDIQRDRLLKC
ncbi:unnamed protein product [Phytophthora lilii]|uniref:Unnamed protein product n=1 Tax=Phytophthora lilii TaxID=2077276 RepID=A0A9W6YHT3_9STRA|nr:unnamed protein product [Phytophthora lilii]